MNDRETRRYDMFGRVQTFGTTNAADFAAGGEAQKRFANIAQIIKALDEEKAKQLASANTAKEVLLDALRLDIQNIARTARAIAQDEPGFADDYRTPDTASQKDLTTTADAYVARLVDDDKKDDAATKAAKAALRAKFIAHELPDDFAQDLADDRGAIRGDDEGSEAEDLDSVESTAAVGRLIRAGMKEANYLDAIMHNKYTRDADKLRAWMSASHIERAPKREKKTTPAPAPVPTA